MTSRLEPGKVMSLRDFTGAGYDKGRNLIWQMAWYATLNLLFRPWYTPAQLRPLILRAFGARVGAGVIIRAGVRVHWPWKLSIGNNVWLGEGCWILNLEEVTVGNNVCISQEAFLCTGSHDRHSVTFEYQNGSILVNDGVWIGTRSVVLRGVVVGRGGVVGAGVVVSKSVPDGSMLTPPSAVIRERIV
jgi:putative colanic acid biosynthesis acetyltransferase WcaF